MARGIENNWQKKAGHQVIRDSGKNAREAAEKAAKLTEKAKLSSAQPAQKPVDVKKPQPSKIGQQTQAQQKTTKPETQHEAAKHSDQAAKQYLNVQRQAKNLSKLATTLKPKSTQKPATEQAVTSKPNVPEGHATRQATQQQTANIAQQAALTQKPIQKGVTKQTTEPKAPKTKGSQKTAKNAQAKTANAKNTSKQTLQPENAAHGAALAGMSGQKVITETKTGLRKGDLEEDGVDEEEQGREASTFSAGVAKSKSASKELGGLLGGSAGESEGSLENGDEAIAAEAVKNAKKAEPLPETDPSFHVYSEFDTTKPGVERVMEQAQIYARHVEKRLNEIAALDHRIDDMFKTKPLSDRIDDMAGELKEEVKRQIKLAFHNSSPYGGVIG